MAWALVDLILIEASIEVKCNSNSTGSQGAGVRWNHGWSGRGQSGLRDVGLGVV